MTTLPAAVLWDMDGTLTDTEKLWDAPLYEFMELMGRRLTLEQRLATIGNSMSAVCTMLLEFAGREPTPKAIEDTSIWITNRMDEIFAEGIPLRPGAAAALRLGRDAGIPMALVTSAERGLTETILDTLGRHFFDVTICGDEVDGRNKPHPEPYLRAARLLGVDPDACVAIEDSRTGATAAAAAGCTVIVVPCEAAVEPEADWQLRDSLIGLELTDLSHAMRKRTQRLMA
jgi:HAD superfamily hydrolase (TIGR01509 family)